MVCIHCGEKTHVINSRAQKRHNQIWRRRACFACNAVFTTSEAALYEASWAVLSREGDLEPFSRDKLFLSLYESCKHRKTALQDASALTDTVIRRLAQAVQSGRLEAHTIAHSAQVALRRFDTAASVHYAAFHAALS